MPTTQYSQVKPGLFVSIILKADQKSGRQVRGTVSQILTRHNHPRGIKVELTDERVGRVQQILPSSPSHSFSKLSMEPNNPWANTQGSRNPYTAQSSQTNQGAAQTYYQSQPQSQSQYQQYQQQSAPSQDIRRSDTEQILAQQNDRAEQVEYMQQFQANAPQSEDDRNQAQLQKEFPNIDSSLIAAIYNERKSQGNLAEVRELLQELNTS
ncbi:uncharacterized protein Z518_09039 [Rhinocladiella mackenziei CBS 650.93]|uniref:Uncharacterized protein n=1 Tax=Rhinocladiella mackenziei CBS 650.93 TaxID=1442369 RepID=A0A0D2I685_9EURO|nr:uncharacterized protein Z518_09039 [Rhinocladiella mackenziei CBS 650.93]KIX01314.1 hypothetical protein Z518_09039 [Rhinocladiella mackenziei CBS 650.93]